MPENSYSSAITCEVVDVEEATAPPTPTPAEGPTHEEIGSVKIPKVPSGPTSSAKRRQRSARRALSDHEMYALPIGGASNPNDEMHRKYLEQRALLMELQVQHMRVRMEEAEHRREEARIYKEIAQKELDLL